MRTSDAQSIQSIIDDNLAQQREMTDGDRRWEQVKSTQYQRDRDIGSDSLRIEYERRRDDVSAAALAAGPLTLEQCLVFALEFNDAIQAQRAAIRAAGGAALLARSRFWPQASYAFRADMTGREMADPNDTNRSRTTSGHAIRLSQTLFEFGTDIAADVTLRSEERDALFAYEESVGNTLAAVRKSFFAILLRAAQLGEREKSLHEFRARHEQVVALEAARRVLEVDVLTARLNMLNEEARINALQQEILREKMNLANLMGFTAGGAPLDIRGDIEPFDLPLEDMVRLALLRSPSIARHRAEIMEQVRLLAQLHWEYRPAVALKSGWKDRLNVAGLEVGADAGAYHVSAFTEAHTDTLDNRFGGAIPLMDEDDTGWFAQVNVTLPLLQGRERTARERLLTARIEEQRHLLRAHVDAVELTVRKAYHTMLERKQDIEILRETVSIARERLRVQERLKELGKISDNELETFRNSYFRVMDDYFTRQIALIAAQEDLRLAMRFFEPAPPTGD